MTSTRSGAWRATAAVAHLLAGGTAVARAQQVAERVPATAFVHVSVIPMDRERVLADQTVVVQGGHVVALGSARKVRIPSDARQVDARGKFLIPGLADMHAHLGFRERLVPLDAAFEQSLSPSERLLMQEQQLFLWLAHGLTTARILDHLPVVFSSRDLGRYPEVSGRDVRGEQVLQLRARAAAGEILSPRIYTSWYILGRLNDSNLQPPLQLTQVAEAVRTYKAAGFDFIKVHPVTLPDSAAARDSVFDSLAATARRAGLPLVGHTVVPLARALQTYKSIEHLAGYAESAGYPPVLNGPTSMAELDALTPKVRTLAVATQQAGVWNCPTLYNAFKNGSPPLALALKRRVVKALQDAGAGLLAGSDRLQNARWTNVESAERAKMLRGLAAEGLTVDGRRLEVMYGYAGATHHELAAFVEAGLTPYQALVTATRNPAAYFGTSDSTGTIAVGKRADLILVDGNPLRDIRQTTRIAGVMLGGRWLDRADLDRRTAEISGWLDRRCSAAAGQATCRAALEAQAGEP